MSRRQRRHRAGRRDVDGIVLLDKPCGPTSNHVLQIVKRAYGARKAGHTGSLDPMASGLLPVCLGEATKVSSFLLEADKHYLLTARFGVRTSTGDAEGEVLETRDAGSLTDQQLARAVADYRGERMQTPPMYSAVKHQGQPLYKLARRGVEVERQPRPISIHSLELLERRGEEVDFSLHCSKGTYVRTLVEDIGEELGCGAHVTRLRRTGVGPYLGDQHSFVALATIEELARSGSSDELDALLQPVDSALSGWPAVTLSADLEFYLAQGQAVQVPKAPTSGLVRLYGPARRFLGMGAIQDDGKVAPRRLFARHASGQGL